MFLTPSNIAGSKEAIVDDLGNRISYEVLCNDCRVFKKFIFQRSFFILFADRTIETLRFYYAVMGNQQVVLLLNPDSEYDFIEKYIYLYRPQYIWFPIGWNGKIDSSWTCLYKTNKHCLYKTGYPFYQMDAELALLLTTSGSTGNPKVVRLSYKNLYENADAFVDALKLKESDKGLLTLPLYYTYGLAVCHMHFIIGATVLITEKKPFDLTLLKFIEKEQMTDLHGVPFSYNMMKKNGMLYQFPSSLRLLTMGGGRAESNLQDTMNKYFYDKGVRVNALYGQTEGTTILTKIHPNDKWNIPGCIGVPCKGMKAFVDAQNGELCFWGSSVCMGYASSYKELSMPNINQGLLRSGDLAKIDSMGRIFLTGRLKRIIKLHGVRINLDDIEMAIETKYTISCACCGEEDQLKIFLIIRELPDQLKEWISRRFKISRSTISCYSIEKFPRYSNGKVNYQVLNQIR